MKRNHAILVWNAFTRKKPYKTKKHPQKLLWQKFSMFVCFETVGLYQFCPSNISVAEKLFRNQKAEHRENQMIIASMSSSCLPRLEAVPTDILWNFSSRLVRCRIILGFLSICESPWIWHRNTHWCTSQKRLSLRVFKHYISAIYHTVFKHLSSRLNIIRLWKIKIFFLQLSFFDVIISCSFLCSLFVMFWNMIMKALFFMVRETALKRWNILWPFLLQGHTIICLSDHQSWKFSLFNVSWKILWPTVAYIRTGQFRQVQSEIPSLKKLNLWNSVVKMCIKKRFDES